MTRDDMILLLREHLSDDQAIGWPNDMELMAFCDQAANFLSEQLIVAKDPTMTRELAVVGKTALPDDFASFVGKVPVKVTGRECESYDPIDMTTARYWARLPAPSSIGGAEELPYTNEQAIVITDIARMLALNRNEYDISHDMALIDTVTKTMAIARQ